MTSASGPLGAGDAEVREQQQEDEEVVERQRALDQVDGRVVDRRGGVAQRGDDRRHEQAEHQPADRPDHALAERGLAPAREQQQVDEQQPDDHRGCRQDRPRPVDDREGVHAKKKASATTT
jgi:hypothetical protein